MTFLIEELEMLGEHCAGVSFSLFILNEVGFVVGTNVLAQRKETVMYFSKLVSRISIPCFN